MASIILFYCFAIFDYDMILSLGKCLLSGFDFLMTWPWAAIHFGTQQPTIQS